MNNKTTVINEQSIKRDWHLIDAKGEIIGRLSSKIARLLLGKNKAIFSPSFDLGDHVVVINAEKISATGKKETDKIYYRHSGYPGGLKSETLGELRLRKPEDIIWKAVYGMLPKNRLRDQRMKKLHIYKGDTHPHTAQITK